MAAQEVLVEVEEAVDGRGGGVQHGEDGGGEDGLGVLGGGVKGGVTYGFSEGVGGGGIAGGGGGGDGLV